MAQSAQNNDDRDDSAAGRLVQDYVKMLSAEQKMLVILKAQLYGGSWEPMLEDLNNRLAGKPYIFKLANRIKDDIERIEQMRKFENDNAVNLEDFVSLDS